MSAGFAWPIMGRCVSVPGIAIEVLRGFFLSHTVLMTAYAHLAVRQPRQFDAILRWPEHSPYALYERINPARGGRMYGQTSAMTEFLGIGREIAETRVCF